MTPVKWGINGPEDKRLQRYIAARLGPIPGWTMSYGFDLWEWAEEDDLREWHGYMHEQMGWSHLLGGRAHKNKLTQIYEGLDYASYEQHRPDYEIYVDTIEARPNKPSFSEDRFRIRDESAPYAYKNYTMEMTRRGLWHSTMAGGVANIWGNLTGGGTHSDGSAPYPKPEWIKTYAQFFEWRFFADMTRCHEMSDALCLKRPLNSHFLFYKEDTSSIDMDLSEMREPQRVVALDAKRPYAEIDLGRFQPAKQSWSAPCPSDWAIAVGDF